MKELDTIDKSDFYIDLLHILIDLRIVPDDNGFFMGGNQDDTKWRNTVFNYVDRFFIG